MRGMWEPDDSYCAKENTVMWIYSDAKTLPHGTWTSWGNEWRIIILYADSIALIFKTIQTYMS